MLTIFLKHLSLGGMGFRIVLASILVFAAVDSALVAMVPGYSAKARDIVASPARRPMAVCPPGGSCIVAPSLGRVVADATRELGVLASSLMVALSAPLFLLSLFVGISSSRYDELVAYLSSLGITWPGLVGRFSLPSLLLSLAASASGVGLGLTVSGLTSTILSALLGSAYVRPLASSSLIVPSLMAALPGWLGFLAGSAIGARVVAGG